MPQVGKDYTTAEAAGRKGSLPHTWQHVAAAATTAAAAAAAAAATAAATANANANANANAALLLLLMIMMMLSLPLLLADIAKIIGLELVSTLSVATGGNLDKVPPC